MSKACQNVLEQFVRCLRESDCMKARNNCYFPLIDCALKVMSILKFPCLSWTLQVQNKSIKTCAKEEESCANFRFSYYNCKRGQLDARTRISGNKHST